MKAAAFNQMIADALTMPLSTVTNYARFLKEADLMTTGARGVNAPDMTALDAARLVIAILSTPNPGYCAERVARFGKIKYSPSYRKRYRGYEVIQPDEFRALFKGETLEDVLASIFALPSEIGAEAACEWHRKNLFHLRLFDFDVLVELFSWRTEGNEIVAERVVPFKGAVMVKTASGNLEHVKGFTPITGGVRTERSISGGVFLTVGLGLLTDKGDAVS